VLFNEEGKSLRDKVGDELMKTVEVKNEGTVHWAPKTLIERDPVAGILKISQGQYARDAVQRFGFAADKGEPTPAYDTGPFSEMILRTSH